MHCKNIMLVKVCRWKVFKFLVKKVEKIHSIWNVNTVTQQQCVHREIYLSFLRNVESNPHLQFLKISSQSLFYLQPFPHPLPGGWGGALGGIGRGRWGVEMCILCTCPLFMLYDPALYLVTLRNCKCSCN